jgi:hypothetical protein
MKHTLTKLAFTLCAGAFILSSTESQAVVIGEDYLLGTWIKPQGPGGGSSEDDQRDRLNFLIDARNATPDDDVDPPYFLTPGSNVPTSGLSEAVGGTLNDDGDPQADGFPEIDLGCGYEYLHVKFGQDSFFFYIAGLEGVNEIDLSLDQQGVSHFNLYNPTDCVPEGGASVALLGLGLAGLGATRRFMSKKA